LPQQVALSQFTLVYGAGGIQAPGGCSDISSMNCCLCGGNPVVDVATSPLFSRVRPGKGKELWQVTPLSLSEATAAFKPDLPVQPTSYKGSVQVRAEQAAGGAGLPGDALPAAQPLPSAVTNDGCHSAALDNAGTSGCANFEALVLRAWGRRRGHNLGAIPPDDYAAWRKLAGEFIAEVDALGWALLQRLVPN
jgi:hypothetical protein